MILLEAEDQQGNKAKIEVSEFRTLADAIKEIRKLQAQINELNDKLAELNNGTNNK